MFFSIPYNEIAIDSIEDRKEGEQQEYDNRKEAETGPISDKKVLMIQNDTTREKQWKIVLFLPFFVSSLWFLGVQIYFFTAKDGREEA